MSTKIWNCDYNFALKILRINDASTTHKWRERGHSVETLEEREKGKNTLHSESLHVESFEYVGPLITGGKFERQCCMVALQHCDVIVENCKLVAGITKKGIGVARVVYIMNNSCY